ncbi:MAG: hypothetical protein RBR19_08455 [Sedimentisphaerales bacterium]|jgi:hypothetical protein|nr:hypothetical protein [Sedimentisphaerales bacterium]NLT78501.1 hypothetical protein [Planctomycetota bacterium]
MTFRYLSDPLFLSCFVLYFTNRWVIKPLLPNSFSQDHLNDLICIPFWVPIMLFMMRKLGLRRDDVPPRGYEILIPLILWSAVFELWLPRFAPFRDLAFSDYVDVLFYAIGALLASLFWKQWYRGKASIPDV